MLEPKVHRAYVMIALNLGLVTEGQALEGVDVTLEELSQQEYIDLPVLIQLVSNVNKYAQVAHWPAVLGAHLGAASHGAVGYVTLSAPSVGKALTTFVHWFKLRCQTYQYEIEQTTEFVDIVIHDTSNNPLFASVFFSAFVRAFEVLIAQLIGSVPANATHIQFSQPPEVGIETLKPIYQSNLKVDGSVNRFRISNEVWYMASPLYDKDAFEFNLKQCALLLEQQATYRRLDLYIQAQLHAHFQSATVIPNALTLTPTLQSIAATLAMSERTLIRKLDELKSPFMQLLQQERAATAKTLLAQAGLTIYQIANILGYRESANFCRAFKTWVGLTPSQYRRQH